MASLDDVRLRNETKSTKPITKVRIKEVAELIRKGYTRTKCIEWIEEHEHLTHHQGKRIYSAAMKYLTPTEEEQSTFRMEILTTLRDIVSESLEKGEKGVAVKALDILNKMSGNYVERADVNVSGDLNFGFKFDTGVEDEDGEDEDN